jgi:hypothetical protein
MDMVVYGQYVGQYIWQGMDNMKAIYNSIRAIYKVVYGIDCATIYAIYLFIVSYMEAFSTTFKFHIS